MQSAQESVHVLGEITVPSGTVILIDFGLMDLWTDDKPPIVAAGVLSPEALRSANNGADLEIRGGDALAAGRAFDRQPHPLYLYDIPRHEVEETKERFDNFAREHGYEAKLVELPARVSPRQRVKQALALNKGAAEIFLHGIHVIAVTDLPCEQVLSVEGRKIAEGEFAGHWQNVSLIINPKAKQSYSRKVGHVAVDMARLMFCDLIAAGKWEHQHSIDGLADFVFWGKDALRLSNKFEASNLHGNIYGFSDRPVNEMMDLAIQAQQHLLKHRLVAAIDFRPHSDHWRMLKAVSEHETESGVIELNGSRCCGFMTSWGDGLFPVYLDCDENHNPIRLRVELATEETIKGMHLVNRFR